MQNRNKIGYGYFRCSYYGVVTDTRSNALHLFSSFVCETVPHVQDNTAQSVQYTLLHPLQILLIYHEISF